MRTWALSAGLSLVAGCSSLTVERLGFPVEELPEPQRGKVEHVLQDVAAVVPVEVAAVRSSLEIYDFLLDEMPFTGGVVRELGRGKWLISRDTGNAGAFTVADPTGYRLRFELVRKEATRRVYVTAGIFNMGILPPLEGSSVVVMRMVPEGPRIRTDATVYVRVETPFYAGLAKSLRGMVEEKVQERSGVFIQAARWVAEEAAERPDWLVMQVEGSDKVDQEVLAEFRKRFLRR